MGANDFTAARVMSGLAKKGVRVPEEIRIVGIDDVKYARLLPVPLTTQHQNCADIGAMAMVTMLQRLAQPRPADTGHSAADAYGGSTVVRSASSLLAHGMTLPVDMIKR